MKNIIIILFLGITFLSSCDDGISDLRNYTGSIVLSKRTNRFGQCFVKLSSQGFEIKEVKVEPCQYNLFEAGDIIQP